MNTLHKLLATYATNELEQIETTLEYIKDEAEATQEQRDELEKIFNELQAIDVRLEKLFNIR